MTYQMSPEMAEGIAIAPPRFQSELPPSVVKSAARTIQILEFFDHVRRDVSISEIATALNYPQSSTSALLRSMVAMGYLEHNRSSRSYRLTRRAGLLGAWLDPSLTRRGALINLVHGLSRMSGESVLLARMNELSVQTIYVASEGADAAASVGAPHCAARSATGMALLAMFEDAQIRSILCRVNADRAQGESAVDVAGFMDRLSECRRDGSFSGPGSDPGMAAVARQVRHRSSGDLLVIAIEGPAARVAPAAGRLGPLLHAALSQLAT